MDSGRSTGGILRLRELIEEHRPEVAFDFRNRFGISYESIGSDISWTEAILLVSVLIRDPSSWLAAAYSEWEYPVSREWMALAHTYELHSAIAARKSPKPYPAPWSDKKNQLGKRNQSSKDVLAKLAQMNPKENDG